MSRAFIVFKQPGELASKGLVVVLGLAFAPLFLATGRGPGGGHAGGAAAVSEAQVAAGAKAFATVAKVFQHPRCLNCHPDGDAPLQYAMSEPHSMNVRRGPDGLGSPGLRCAACHMQQPLGGLHMPPGVDAPWRLAPRALAFEGKTPAQMAAAVAGSGMTDAELLHHVEQDPLVLYGWDPGEGRGKVSVEHAEFVKAFKTWIEAGKPAPVSE